MKGWERDSKKMRPENKQVSISYYQKKMTLPDRCYEGGNQKNEFNWGGLREDNAKGEEKYRDT